MDDANVEVLHNAFVPQPFSSLVPTASTTLATIIIGFTVATTLYGISVLQTYYYFLHFSSDAWSLKLYVASLWAFDTLTTIFVAQTFYFYAVLNYGNPVVGSSLPWTMGAQSSATDLITFFAHMYFVVQIWNASRSKWIVGPIIFLSLGALASDTVSTALCLIEGEIASIAEPLNKIVGTLSQCLVVVCDIAIMLTLIHYFRVWGKETITVATSRTLNSLIIYAVSRGVITAVAQVLFLSSYLAYPERTYWIPFNLVVAKLYVNSVLSSLNGRKRFEKEPQVFVDDLSLVVFRQNPARNGESGCVDTEAQNTQIRIGVASRTTPSNAAIHVSLDTKHALNLEERAESRASGSTSDQTSMAH